MNDPNENRYTKIESEQRSQYLIFFRDISFVLLWMGFMIRWVFIMRIVYVCFIVCGTRCIRLVFGCVVIRFIFCGWLWALFCFIIRISIGRLGIRLSRVANISVWTGSLRRVATSNVIGRRFLFIGSVHPLVWIVIDYWFVVSVLLFRRSFKLNFFDHNNNRGICISLQNK